MEAWQAAASTQGTPQGDTTNNEEKPHGVLDREGLASRARQVVRV